jgi:hypothetical protein
MLRIFHTILCMGLNLLIPRLRENPKLLWLLIAVMVLNEIRGVYVAYSLIQKGLLL